MKSLILTLVLCGWAVTAGCGGNTSTAADDVLARVDGTDIKSPELEKQFQNQISGADQPPSPQEAQDLKLQILNQMISDQILLEMAAKQQLTATDAEVDVKFNEFKARFSEEAFKEQLKQQKLSAEEIRSDLRKSITLEKLVNKEITSKITVSDQEIKDFYEKNKARFNLPEGFHIAHILVTPFPEQDNRNTKHDDAKNPEEARQKAARLLKEVQSGTDFALIARDYSEDPNSAPNGGDLDFQALPTIANIDPKVAEAVRKLKVGETYPTLVESRFGFHIMKLLDHDKGGLKEFSDPRIKAQIHEAIFNGKGQTLKSAFFETVRNNAKVSNFMAQRILDQAGKESATAPAAETAAPPSPEKAPEKPAEKPAEAEKSEKK